MGTYSETEDLVNEIKGKTIIHWNYRGFKKLPDAIRACANDISEIYLKDNEITILPNWMNEFVNLTHLYLHGNKVKKVPWEMINMKKLSTIDISGNGFDFLPSLIGEFRALEILMMDNNNLQNLPIELLKLENLRMLSIDNNRFVALPEWLGSLKKLEQLSVDNNMLEELPNRLTYLPELNFISFCSNRLSYLPLNGFASCSLVYYRNNPYLNYLSYPVYRQLLKTFGRDGITLGQSQCKKKHNGIKNLQISLKCDNEGENIMIDLPRQLLNIHGIDVCKPAGLWELALRKIYRQRESTTYEDDKVSLGIAYNLLKNGSIAVCTNENCGESIFTEAWLIAATCQQDYDSTNVPVVLLYCSQNCARLSDSLSDELEILQWEIVH